MDRTGLQLKVSAILLSVLTFFVAFLATTALTDIVCENNGYYEEYAFDESDY